MRSIRKIIIAIVATCWFLGCTGGPQPVDVTSEETIIAGLLSGLSLRQRIGQRFVGWIPRNGISEDIETLLAAGEIGGFIVYPWNFETVEEVRTLTTTLQNMALLGRAGIPLFLAADQEGGRVAAFRFDEFVQLPAAFYFGTLGDEAAVEAAAFINARQLDSIGINMNLAPVLDLYGKPDRTIIGDRSFGDDVTLTTVMGKAFVAGTMRGGVIPVIKHFPGHGLSSVDSHGNLPVIDSLRSEELERHVTPFAAAIETGVPAVMPAHLLLPELDKEYPVTLSQVFIQDFLRGELGFERMIISDGLAMGALAKHYSVEETLERCFQVGIDAILVHSEYSITELIDKVEHMVNAGSITRRQVDEGLLRILREKRIAGILR